MDTALISSNALKILVKKIFPHSSGSSLCAFAYGSAVFSQHGRPSADSQLDLILIVDDPVSWHTINLKYNPQHYNGILSKFHSQSQINDLPVSLKFAITKWPGPQIYFNPFVRSFDSETGRPIIVKYGVVQLDKVLTDLRTWCNLYIAGRLHKPVVWVSVESDSSKHALESLYAAQQANLFSALSFALLQVGSKDVIDEFDLFHSITALSYLGDWRMIIGEDKNKINRLVSGEDRLSRFRSLYKVALTALLTEKLINCEQLSDDSSKRLNVQILQPTDRFLAYLPDEFCIKATTGFADASSARNYLSNLTSTVRRNVLAKTAFNIVRRSSLQQTALGIYSAGLSRSVSYAASKVRKMFASFGLLKWS